MLTPAWAERPDSLPALAARTRKAAPLPDLPGRYPVPWITQYATPPLIAAIAYEGHPPADDPAWRESGAPDQETYGRWCARLCGMACLRMALATGGHLVLVTGYAGGQVSFRDPSGHTPQAGIAALPMPVFDRFAAHRGLALHV